MPLVEPENAVPGAEALFQRLGYTFTDINLFQQALTHKSHPNENRLNAQGDNERLEFLGDAVLDFVISELLMVRYPEMSEGELSIMRASLVSEAALAEIARELQLGPCLRLGRGEVLSGGMDKDSLLSDTLEALFAAVYLDSFPKSGMITIQAVIERIFTDRLDAPPKEKPWRDHKTELQEHIQKKYKETVRYRVLSEKGPDHEKVFRVAVYYNTEKLGLGSGRTKKLAEQAAAGDALAAIEQKQGETP